MYIYKDGYAKRNNNKKPDRVNGSSSTINK